MTDQLRLDDKDQRTIDGGPSAPVECMGMTFESDHARREHFRALLVEKLRNPEFRKQPGFPEADDDEIIRMSDPPYYTACPNPFLEDIVRAHSQIHHSAGQYHRDPLAQDVSKGKNEAIYSAHSYHTKVPPAAIVEYLRHFTEEGDLVLDGFCGTGMTGVACARTGRRAVLQDLSPLATSIANGWRLLGSPELRRRVLDVAEDVLVQAEGKLGWIYEVERGGHRYKGNFFIWADVHSCPECQTPSNYWDLTIRMDEGRQLKAPVCPACGSTFPSKAEDKYRVREIDPVSGSEVEAIRAELAMVCHFDGRSKRRTAPQSSDYLLVDRILREPSPTQLKAVELPAGYNLNQPRESHLLQYVHQFYTYRNLLGLAAIRDAADAIEDYEIRTGVLFILQSILDRNSTKRNRFIVNTHNPSGRVNGPLANTLYIPSIQVEMNVFEMFRQKIADFGAVRENTPMSATAVSTGSSTVIPIPDATVDYVFVDPPFGGNIMYSEVNFIWEYWLGARTDASADATINPGQGKEMSHYSETLNACYAEFYRVLKPGRWITTEFHNSQNSVWMAIQEALGRAGFVVADVRALDKGSSHTIHQDSKLNTTKVDLVISAYRPTVDVAAQDLSQVGTDAVWAFVSEHLANLPVVETRERDSLGVVFERGRFALFDRMIAYFVYRGTLVPISAPEFYAGLNQRYPERDGMYFLPEQVAEYDKRRAKVAAVEQLSLIVTDESSAIQWVRQQLSSRPQKFSELQPLFMREAQQSWAKHETHIELMELLEENFLIYDGIGAVPSQIKSYLSSNWREYRNVEAEDSSLRAKAKDRWYVPEPGKSADLEKLRERQLLREFEQYRTSTARKMRLFRTEAVRAGFKRAYEERDWATIVAVAGRLPEAVVQEDEKLLMYYDVARMRVG